MNVKCQKDKEGVCKRIGKWKKTKWQFNGCEKYIEITHIGRTMLHFSLNICGRMFAKWPQSSLPPCLSQCDFTSQ